MRSASGSRPLFNRVSSVFKGLLRLAEKILSAQFRALLAARLAPRRRSNHPLVDDRVHAPALARLFGIRNASTFFCFWKTLSDGRARRPPDRDFPARGRKARVARSATATGQVRASRAQRSPGRLRVAGRAAPKIILRLTVPRSPAAESKAWSVSPGCAWARPKTSPWAAPSGTGAPAPRRSGRPSSPEPAGA